MKKFLLAMLAVFAFAGCGKNDPPPPKPKIGPAVYILGRSATDADTYKCWRNGEVVLDIKKADHNNSIMAVSNGKPYLVSTCADGISYHESNLWMPDGSSIQLRTDKTILSGIEVIDNVIYIVGYIYNELKVILWRVENGNVTSQTLTENGESCAMTYANGKLYILGIEKKSGGNTEHKYWIVDGSNISEVVVHTSTGVNTYLSRIAVSGSDVYTAGHIKAKPCYFKNNGAPTMLSTENGGVYDIVVSGNDVYVSGYDTNKGTRIWKNGTVLYNHSSAIRSMAMFGNDLYYVVSKESVYHKNNETFALPVGIGYVFQILVIDETNR